jgi:hypothetical protein
MSGKIFRKGALVPILLFLLGCIQKEEEAMGSLSEDRERIRIETPIDRNALERNEGVIEVSESKEEDGVLIVLLKEGKKDSLPERLRGRRSSGELPFSGNGEPGSYPERSSPEPSPTLDLPDIFDIFTRIL